MEESLSHLDLVLGRRGDLLGLRVHLVQLAVRGNAAPHLRHEKGQRMVRKIKQCPPRNQRQRHRVPARRGDSSSENQREVWVFGCGAKSGELVWGPRNAESHMQPSLRLGHTRRREGAKCTY